MAASLSLSETLSGWR